MNSAPAPPSRPWSRRTEGLLAVGFWLALGTLAVVRRAVGPWHETAGIPASDVVETLAEYGLWALLTPLIFWLARAYRIEREGLARRLAVHVLIGVGVAVAVGALTRGVLRPVLSPELAAARPWSMAEMVTGLRFLDELIIYLAVLAAGAARDALLRLREREAEASRLLADRVRLEAQLTEARLSALRMQLNPHFLFNTLNAVSALVERDPAGVRTMIARLSSLLRRVLDDSGAAEVPLRDELAFVHDYLDVQRVRFQGGLEVEEAIAPDVLDALVPPLLLQPLVENAVGHGVRSLEGVVGRLRLAARRDGGRLVLAVEDNGPGLAGGDGLGGSGGVGLTNTRARLDALYGGDGVLSVRDRPEGGVVAEVTLPYRTVAPLDAAPADG
ncbi:sensor histidine kinase [Rubrivirga sp. IMCC45206]|uniref:sensor histidine kinase n=1 Tax=Rubrivirga sp. IMCC45206 TaxID=3391614 RepID=UPI00398FE1CD